MERHKNIRFLILLVPTFFYHMVVPNRLKKHFVNADITLSHGKKVKHNNRSPEGGRYMSSPTTTLPNTKPSDVILQHTNRQIHGYLSEQADMIEK